MARKIYFFLMLVDLIICSNSLSPICEEKSIAIDNDSQILAGQINVCSKYGRNTLLRIYQFLNHPKLQKQCPHRYG